MSIKESALTAITTISQSDFVRMVTSAGASRRATVANLAKSVVESYSGSNLAGSSQSVKTAINYLNVNALKAKKARTSVALRPNADVSGDVVTTVASGSVVFTRRESASIDRIIYISGGTVYYGYAYSTNFEAF